MIDLTYSARLDWSLIAAGALLMIWVWFCPWFLMKRPSFLKVAIPVILSTLAFLLLVDLLVLSMEWFLHLALPLVLIPGVLVIVIGELIIRRVIRGFAIPAAILAAIGVLVVGIELVTEMAAYGRIQIGWSLFVLLPCLALAGVALTIARRQAVHEEIRKRLHL